MGVAFAGAGRGCVLAVVFIVAWRGILHGVLLGSGGRYTEHGGFRMFGLHAAGIERGR